ncbi:MULTISPECIES: ATP-binding cassette domain-containing protein [Thiorhodovibrio]|uniref:ATP-binding cassette domain-containing protein n=1 Tax=Thiorhodovibrio TaxID=61593 RepID=UPI001912DE0E|nr:MULTISPECIES: ATP-binding cassette domain-containing protein [Thiorhodovibrio]MBK5968623.1 ABC transporter ATP-binding protein [Thiorhodovibrio winogradskyi]WPL11273.1 Glycine betaine/carnitine/choline transport ATP-binding protein OpuCA [Thiorhodovibrio litoralis]
MFELHQVTKSYGATLALERVRLSIPRGRTIALIGPSGCGKSTLLRTLIGLIEPDAGHVCFDGQRLERTTICAQRRRMGYVIQQGGLFPHLTARENVALMARFLDWNPTRIETRLSELLELTHFPRAALDRYPAELSGGQNQRLGLMRALMLDPEVLLLDEPLGALDPMIRYDLQEELKQIFATLGKTVVLVTHDLTEAAFLADTIVLMRAGRIVQSGRLADMLRAPAEPFVERFVRAQRSHLDALGTPE